MKFHLQIAPYSLNLYRNAHHMKLHKVKKDIGEDVHWQLIAQKARPIQCPVQITFQFNFQSNQKHDLDNYVATAKMILDALTPMKLPKKTYGMGIIPDDDSKHIIRLIFEEGKRRDNSVDLIIDSLE